MYTPELAVHHLQMVVSIKKEVVSVCETTSFFNCVDQDRYLPGIFFAAVVAIPLWALWRAL